MKHVEWTEEASGLELDSQNEAVQAAYAYRDADGRWAAVIISSCFHEHSSSQRT